MIEPLSPEQVQKEATRIAASPLFEQLITGLTQQYFNQWLIAPTLEDREKIHALALGAIAFQQNIINLAVSADNQDQN